MTRGGKLLSTTGSLAGTISKINPFLYRGYYYDSETGFYYLNSRYYDPQTGRFLNVDAYASVGQGVICLPICLNEAVNLTDSSGNIALVDDATIVFAALAVTTYVVVVYTATTPSAQRSWAGLGNSLSQSFTRLGNRAKNAFASISQSISKFVSKAKVKIRNERNRYDYWIAAYIGFTDGRGTYVPTKALSYSSAISYVRAEAMFLQIRKVMRIVWHWLWEMDERLQDQKLAEIKLVLH